MAGRTNSYGLECRPQPQSTIPMYPAKGDGKRGSGGGKSRVGGGQLGGKTKGIAGPAPKRQPSNARM